MGSRNRKKRFGTTIIKVPFESLEPTVLAKKISLPIQLKSDSISQFQLLHSKFGRPGELNPGFNPGKINFVLQSISVFSTIRKTYLFILFLFHR